MKNYCEECGRPIGEMVGTLCISCQDEFILADVLDEGTSDEALDLVDLLLAA